jgi:hypothetical protein
VVIQAASILYTYLIDNFIQFDVKSLHWSFYFLHTKIWILTYRFLFLFDFWCLMPLSAISWQPVLVVEEANISAISLRPVLVVEEAGENHWPWASNW